MKFTSHGCVTFQVIRVDRVSGAGWTTVEAFVEGLDNFAGYQLQVQAKNENYIARCFDVSSGKRVEGPVLACTPDLITIIDSESGEHYCKHSKQWVLQLATSTCPMHK